MSVLPMSVLPKIFAVLALAGAAAGCTTVAGTVPGPDFAHTELSRDGACVLRTTAAFDPESGYVVRRTQRFCGGRAEIAR